MHTFRGRVAIITGSSKGIGLASASHLLAEGCSVVINGRSPEQLAAALKCLRSEHPDADLHSVVGDVIAPPTRERLVDDTIARFGRIDILINNAGGGSSQRCLEDIDDDDWQQALELNLGSVFRLCRKVVPTMRAQRYGKIVNVSSLAGRFKGRLSGPPYSAAKAGLQGLTRHLAFDLAPFNITVNAVAPGIVRTDRALAKWEARSVGEREQLLAQIPMHRFAEPAEVAKAIAFLVSDDSSYVTGVTLDVNGGSFMS